MPELHIWFYGLVATLVPALLTWLASVPLRDTSIVDRVWSLLLGSAALAYAWLAGEGGRGPRTAVVLALVMAWGVRLAVHITVRNWGHGEDRRYQQFRRNNDPGFAFKSIYIVFGLQAVLAWLISLPLLGAICGTAPLGWLDYAGIALWGAGWLVETLADAQLARFIANPENRGTVMDRGLWHYSRHPNYFGEVCVWWGFFLLALGAGAWWSVVGPLLLTVMLLRVSGVTLLEKDIGERRPGYRDYVARTSAFIPWPPRARHVTGSTA